MCTSADLSRQLADMGWEVDIFTRRDRVDAPDVEDLAPGARLFHVDAGPPVGLPPIEIAAHVSEFTSGVEQIAARNAPYDLIHSHYWVAGLSGIELSRQWQVPHAVMFHTLGAVKEVFQQPEPPFRIAGERRVIACADAVIGATSHERAFLIGQYQARCVPRPGGALRDRPGDVPSRRSRGISPSRSGGVAGAWRWKTVRGSCSSAGSNRPKALTYWFELCR